MAEHLRLKYVYVLLTNLDRLRADASAERIQELTYPHIDRQSRSAVDLNLRARLRPGEEHEPQYKSKKEYAARMSLMGVGFGHN